MATISKIRAEFDARQATEAMYALSERARGLNKLLADQRKRWEETGDPKIKDTIDGNIRRLEAELSAVEKLNRTIEKSITTESAFQQVLTKGTGSMSVARLEGAQRSARAIIRNINPSDENAIDQMDEAQRVMNETGRRLASLKNGFTDAMQTVADGVEGKALPELKRLEAALTDAQKFSVDQAEWNRYQEAIGKVRLEMQAATAASVQMEEQNAKAAASLKYGFEDAFTTYNKGIENMSLPELNRLEASLTEVQKFSANSEEWQKYGEAIDKVRMKIQGITGEYLSVEKAMSYGDEIRRQTFTGTIADLERAKKLLTDYRKTIKQTADGADELKRVDDNLEVIERQIKGTYLTTEKFNEILKAPKGKSFDELKAAIEQAEKQLYGMRRETSEEREAFLKLHEQIEAAKDEMKQFGEAQEDTTTGMDELKEKAKQLAGAYLSLQGFQMVWDLNLNMSDAMANVRKTTGMTAEQVEQLTQRITAIDTRAANEQLMTLATTAGQLGLSAEEDVLGFTSAANQVTVALDELGSEGVLQLMKVAQVSGALDAEMGDVETTLLKVGSSINELSAASSASAGPITDFIGRVGGVASTAKISMSEIAALGATTDALAISAELAGTQINVFLGGMQKNTKAVADLLGMSKDAVQSMMDNGQAMDVFVQVVERMGELNATELSDFLKQMGSSGSRATQVFSTLSQNVDQLKDNLRVSNDAYREGISITEEYNKVNDTAAGKFQRLKNEVQEVFISESAQSFFGTVIDGLRSTLSLMVTLKDYITAVVVGFALWKVGVGGMIWTYLINPIRLAITGVHSLSFQVKGLAATWRAAWKSMDAATKANLIMAVASAVYMLGRAIWDTLTKVDELKKAMAELDQQEVTAIRDVDHMVDALGRASAKADDAAAKHKKLEEETDALRKEVDTLRNSTDKGAESTANLSRKEEELEKKERDLKAAADEQNKANKERSNLISEINSKYSSYLGYMLDEETAALQVAQAHRQIVAALKEEMEQKRMKREQEAIDAKYDEEISGYQTSSLDELDKLPGDIQRRIMNRYRAVLANVTFDIDPTTQKGTYRRRAAEGFGEATFQEQNGRDNASLASFELMKPVLRELIRQEAIGKKGVSLKEADLNKYMEDIWGLLGVDEGFWQYTRSSLQKERATMESRNSHQRTQENLRANSVREADVMNADAYQRITKSLANNQQLSTENVRDLGQQVAIIAANLKKYEGDLKDADKFIGKDSEVTLENAVNTMFAARTKKERDLILAAAKKKAKDAGNNQLLESPGGGGGGGGGRITTTRPEAESTDYSKMGAEQLVNRRKKMQETVKDIQSDADVQSVLNNDPALRKAIENGMSADMQTVIDWYNTERLKIQDELHTRHLTNSGSWDNPKKAKEARKQFESEVKAYLDELDAYYTERKTIIEQARNDEEITEGEAWRRTIQNDNEWQTRRAELQKLYSRKQKEVTQEELDAIIRIIAERTGDSESFVKAAIAKTNQFVDAIEKSGDKGAAIVHRWMSQVVLDTERSYLKAAQAIGKQMKFIEDTLAKERPYDGITKNLQDNLDKMGVLAAKYRRENEELARQGKEPKYSNEQITAQSYDEMAFYLRQAADAYSIDIDELLRRMVKEGMTATAEEISKSDMLKQAVMGQLRKTYQEVQDAIKKEASQIKKDVEIIWNDDARGIGGMSMKATFDKALAQLGMQQDSVSRANSLIGAGAASDNVASRLAMKQIEVQMRMQKAQYDMYRVQTNQRMAALKAEAEEHQRIAELEKQAGHEAAAAEQRTKAMVALRDAENVRLSLGLTLAEETKKEEEQKAELLKIQEESQNRLYTSLREWADLLTSSLQGVFEASHAGDAEYYNERAKLNLTGKGGPGAGTYVVIDDAGTSDATAHYEYLDEREALERQHEIEIQNAQAEAWKKLWDDINMKMSEQITDWMNAALQQQAVAENTAALKLNTDAEQRHLEVVSDENGIVEYNTDAVRSNTSALQGLTQQLAQGITIRPATDGSTGSQQGGTTAAPAAATPATGTTTPVSTETTTEGSSDSVVFLPGVTPGVSWTLTEEQMAAEQEQLDQRVEMQREAAEKVRIANEAAFHSSAKTEKDTGNQMAKSNASTFAKMTMSANLYGIAYQAMSNDNLSATQKFEMIALQSVGNFAISSLTAFMSKAVAEGAVNEATVLGKLWSQLGWAAAPVFAIFTGLLGAAMGAATSAVSKSKSQIAQATGSSVGAGRLATGMQTYAEGNVNELTDPASLTPGRQYNVDGADGKTYRARYMGKGAKTHITNGPEFHLVGEAGREAIIDAKTTRLLQMNDTGIWRDIQTLYNGGSISGLSNRRRRGGVRAYADGNIGEFEDALGGEAPSTGTGGMEMEQMLTALDRNSAIQEALLERLNQPIYAQNILYGPDGLPNIINKLNKEAQRHGEKYL